MQFHTIYYLVLIEWIVIDDPLLVSIQFYLKMDLNDS